MRSQDKFVENYFFLENYVTSKLVRELLLTMLYSYQPLPIFRYQVRFYADNYF